MDFPLPFSPRRVVSFPGSMVRSMSLRTRLPWKDLFSFLSRNHGVLFGMEAEKLEP